MPSSKEPEDFQPTPFHDPEIDRKRMDILREAERQTLARLCAPLLRHWDPKIESAQAFMERRMDEHARLLRAKAQARALLLAYHVRIDGDGIHFGGGEPCAEILWGDLLCAVQASDSPSVPAALLATASAEVER